LGGWKRRITPKGKRGRKERREGIDEKDETCWTLGLIRKKTVAEKTATFSEEDRREAERNP